MWDFHRFPFLFWGSFLLFLVSQYSCKRGLSKFLKHKTINNNNIFKNPLHLRSTSSCCDPFVPHLCFHFPLLIILYSLNLWPCLSSIYFTDYRVLYICGHIHRCVYFLLDGIILYVNFYIQFLPTGIILKMFYHVIKHSLKINFFHCCYMCGFTVHFFITGHLVCLSVFTYK